MHGLMNAYQQAFKRFEKESLVPKWKTLILTDQGGHSWAESSTPDAAAPSQAQRATQETGSALCSCQRSTKTLSTWRDVWYDQRRQQVNQTTVEQQAIETASQSTSQDYAAARGASLPTMQGKSKVLTTGWLVLSMSSFGSSTSPSCLANTQSPFHRHAKCRGAHEGHVS